MSNMIDLFKEQNQKNKGDTLRRLPAKVVSYSVSIYPVTQVESNGTTDDIDNIEKIRVTFDVNGHKYTRTMDFKNDGKKADPTLNSGNMYVFYSHAKQNMFATQNKDLIDKYQDSQKATYNGKEVVVNNVEYARVEVLGYENLPMVLPNRTNTVLANEDEVWIYYWGDISSGYIFSNNLAQGGSISFLDFLSNMEAGTHTQHIQGETGVTTQGFSFPMQKVHKNPIILVSVISDVYNDFVYKQNYKNGNIEIKLIALGNSVIPTGNYIVHYLIIDI